MSEISHHHEAQDDQHEHPHEKHQVRTKVHSNHENIVACSHVVQNVHSIELHSDRMSSVLLRRLLNKSCTKMLKCTTAKRNL